MSLFQLNAYLCIMDVVIINGPNLNLLGVREKGIYGEVSFADYYSDLQQQYPKISFSYYQSNVEGELINKLHEVGFTANAIILNAGGYTHTSVAISDAIAAISTPVIEVHISNIFSREEFRNTSLITRNCQGSIGGFGLHSYHLAVQSLLV